MSAAGRAPGDAEGRPGSQVLADLPVVLWGPLLRAVRRAMGRLQRSDLPVVLRPFADWKPERLSDERSRVAIARALAADARLRESVGTELEPAGLYAAAGEGDATRLAAAYGEAQAAAALAARGRWEPLAVLAAETADRLAARERAGAEASARRAADVAELSTRRLSEEVTQLRAERDALRRRWEATDAQQRRVAEENTRLREELAQARDRAADAAQRLVAERRRSSSTADRLRRRLEREQARGRADSGRVERVARHLDELAQSLRDSLGEITDPEPAAPRTPDQGPVPREVRPADRGRPAVLPPGLGPEDPLAIPALLQLEGLAVFVDGYNVTKDMRGRPHIGLPEQRQWLVRVLAGLAARYPSRFVVVFDGSDPHPGTFGPVRGVGVIFTEGDEIADDRIVALVEALDPQAPVLVVTSDRAVRADCLALDANVVSSGAFLTATGA